MQNSLTLNLNRLFYSVCFPKCLRSHRDFHAIARLKNRNNRPPATHHSNYYTLDDIPLWLPLCENGIEPINAGLSLRQEPQDQRALLPNNTAVLPPGGTAQDLVADKPDSPVPSRSIVLLQHLRNNCSRYPYGHQKVLSFLQQLNPDFPFSCKRLEEAWEAQASSASSLIHQMSPEHLVTYLELLSVSSRTRWAHVLKALVIVEQEKSILTYSQVLRVITSLGTLCSNLGLSNIEVETPCNLGFIGEPQRVTATDAQKQFLLPSDEASQQNTANVSRMTFTGFWQKAAGHLVDRLLFGRFCYWDTSTFFDHGNILSEKALLSLFQSLKCMKLLTPQRFLLLLQQLFLVPGASRCLGAGFLIATYRDPAFSSSWSDGSPTTLTLWELWVSSIGQLLATGRTVEKEERLTFFHLSGLFVSWLQKDLPFYDHLTGECISSCLLHLNKAMAYFSTSENDSTAQSCSFPAYKLQQTLLNLASNELHTMQLSSLITILHSLAMQLSFPQPSSSWQLSVSKAEKLPENLLRKDFLASCIQCIRQDAVFLSLQDCYEVLQSLSKISQFNGKLDASFVRIASELTCYVTQRTEQLRIPLKTRSSNSRSS